MNSRPIFSNLTNNCTNWTNAKWSNSSALLNQTTQTSKMLYFFEKFAPLKHKTFFKDNFSGRPIEAN